MQGRKRRFIPRKGLVGGASRRKCGECKQCLNPRNKQACLRRETLPTEGTERSRLDAVQETVTNKPAGTSGVRAMRELAGAEARTMANVRSLKRIRGVSSRDFAPPCDMWHTKIYKTDEEGVNTLVRGSCTGGERPKRVRKDGRKVDKKDARTPVAQPSVAPYAVTQGSMLADIEERGWGRALRRSSRRGKEGHRTDTDGSGGND
jgi:hypothetical protein